MYQLRKCFEINQQQLRRKLNFKLES